MLRDYLHTENWRLIDRALKQFIELPDRLSLIGFGDLTPDSFIWKIFDGQTVYYLYAEDYVPSLDHVKKQVAQFAPTGAKLIFLPVNQPIALEDSTPNKMTEEYRPPQNEYKFMKYALQSGYDFVFLLKSDEKLEDNKLDKTG